jgi:glycosyltransferase involved in cell wall biosynthesis
VKVLLVSGEFPPQIGGVADYTALLGRALQEHGVEVAVATSIRADDAKQPFPVHAGLPHWGWSTWPTLYLLAQQEAPDIVHIQYQTAAYAMHPAICMLPIWLRHRGHRVVTTFHDLRDPYLFPKAGRLRTTYRSPRSIQRRHGRHHLDDMLSCGRG